ncbi:hypothetical protein LZ30DRAFT_708883 [Colletotrichum cereale]|nr:hypothetical protein LZ30DRAFT_708883 [Colletotrichum cereale]
MVDTGRRRPLCCYEVSSYENISHLRGLAMDFLSIKLLPCSLFASPWFNHCHLKLNR